MVFFKLDLKAAISRHPLPSADSLFPAIFLYFLYYIKFDTITIPAYFYRKGNILNEREENKRYNQPH